jgi:hypothetical protein
VLLLSSVSSGSALAKFDSTNVIAGSPSIMVAASLRALSGQTVPIRI